MGTQLLDLGVVCLVCLREEPGYCSIYGQDLETPHMQIVDKIRNCSVLQLEQTMLDRLPDKICHGCRNELSITYRFQLKCVEAQKVFQNLTTVASPTADLLEVDELTKLELAHHQSKLPASLKIKRLDTLATSSTSLLLPQSTLSTMTATTTATASAGKVEYYNEDTLALIPDPTGTLVLQDVDGITLALDGIEVPHKDDISANEEVKLLTLSSEWQFEKSEQSLKLEDQEQQPPQVLYEIETELEADSPGTLEFHDLPKTVERPASLPPKRKAYKRVSPIGQSCNTSYSQGSDTDNDNGNVDGDEDYALPKAPKATQATRRAGRRPRNATASETKAKKAAAAAQRPRNRRGVERLPKICDICGNTYKYQHTLNAHMRRHNNERPFPCEVCNKAFISNVELRRHMRVHTGQKPYSCQYCERRFSDFGSSKKHERIHTGERPYVCDVCHKGFAYAHVLSVHKRTHTGKKQFQCTQCDKGFTKKIYLVTHLQQHRVISDATAAAVAARGKLAGGTSSKNVSNALRLSFLAKRKYQQQHYDELDDDENVVLAYDEHVDDDEDDEDEDDAEAEAEAEQCDDDGNVSVGIGMDSKVLEECIVTNEFMFNEQEDDEEADEDIDEYDDDDDVDAANAVADEDDDINLANSAINRARPPVHVKGPYELVNDLLSTDDLEVDVKYMIN